MAATFSGINMPTGNATLCVSVASRPSRFGIAVHNAAYRACELDYLYKALQVEEGELKPVVEAVKALGIRGMSVSMPFKQAVIPMLDKLDPIAEKAGAVNTVVNDDGFLTGYNTDVAGGKAALQSIEVKAGDSALVLGAGGVARAIATALGEIGVKDYTFCARDAYKAGELAQTFGVGICAWDEREMFHADVLINATSIGMAPEDDQLPLDVDALDNFKKVMDVVATPPVSKLVQTAREQGMPAADGLTMTLHQAYAQFELYTGASAPREVMQAAAQSLMKG